ncbi:MAG: AEC family transporter [Bdellovibrionota bacterium]
MANFLLLGVCLLAGILFRRTGKLPLQTPAVLNALVIYLAFPATVLLNLHSIKLSAELLYPALMPWVCFGAGAIFFRALAARLHWDRGTLGALFLAGSLGNTSFVGFPLLEALFGPWAISIGVVTDQPGTFLVLSTLGIVTASFFASRNARLPSILKRVALFPPFLAMVAALALLPFRYPLPLHNLLDRLSATLVPLALLSVGFQLRLDSKSLRGAWKPLAAGLFFKLFLAPALIALIYVLLLHAHGEVIRITIVQAAMAPAITAAVVAADYGLDSELANLLVGLGIPLSLVSVPLWARIAGYLA